MTHEPQPDSLATRRGVLAGVGLAGLAGVITACGAGGSSKQSRRDQRGDHPGGPGERAPPRPAAARASAPSSAPAANALASTSQIPVGGGADFPGAQVVVTQPAASEFKAFSAVCTHMGCIVNQIGNGTIDCPCHGSQYSIKTGAVVAGPAPTPLPAKNIKVSGGSIFLE